MHKNCIVAKRHDTVVMVTLRVKMRNKFIIIYLYESYMGIRILFYIFAVYTKFLLQSSKQVNI